MPIRYEKHITRAMLQAEPHALWVFGDNLLRKGYGGQAKEMRGEPNAVGIATKRKPALTPDAFFSDADVDTFVRHAKPVFERLGDHLRNGGTVVLPEDGIGTGRAQLRERAPAVWNELEGALKGLEAIGN
ncbi:hypothetical protein MFUR16E_04635 [Methylobacterium fujisawaense]|uniref:DUF7831 domain-containing protein n=1 Tax=Methylobacterium fujisawaense TaxID=107400 RepID=UPI002F2E225C